MHEEMRFEVDLMPVDLGGDLRTDCTISVQQS